MEPQTQRDMIKYSHDNNNDNGFRTKCMDTIRDIMEEHKFNSVRDSLVCTFMDLFDTVPHRIELCFDGEYLNPKIDTISKDKLSAREGYSSMYRAKDGSFVVEECMVPDENIDEKDAIYTFHNKEILLQSTFSKIINNYTGKEIMAIRLDEEPIIIMGDDVKSILFYQDRMFYCLSYTHTLNPYIKDCVVLETDDEDQRYFDYVVYTQHGFDTTELPVKKQNIDITKNYNDDLPHEDIQAFIESDRSGLCILYGAPGTGKTSYIRHLMYTCKDVNFMILNTSCFDAINDSSFVNLIVNNQDSVIILEDCEDLMIERNTGGNSRIATLLNLSDGILGDALRLKFICTFNSKISKIDSAVLRKGRTHVKYEFKPLCTAKANIIAQELNTILPLKKGTEGYTLAEIYYNENTQVDGGMTPKVGFFH